MERIKLQELTDLSLRALTNNGMRAKDAKITVNHFLENEFSGKASHGLVRIVEAIKTMRKYGVPDKDPEIEFDNEQVLRLNANRQIGVVAAWHALEKGIQKAQNNALTFVGVRDYIASSGALSFYLRRAAEEGYITLMGCNSVALVAPVGGKKRMLGTNPFGCGIPSSDGQHFIADFATSAIAYGKVMVMKDKGQTVPEGCMVDENGHPSTDPADAYNGAILPLADYRGFSLGLMIELLAGPLIGAASVKDELYNNDGLYMIFINPEKFGTPDTIDQISTAFKSILSTPRAPGAEPISIPGSRSNKTLEQTIAKGHIEVAEKTLGDLKSLLDNKG